MAAEKPDIEAGDEGRGRVYPRPLYAWLVVALLVIASLVAYVDRQIVAIVVGPMKADLQATDTQVGWLYGIFAVFFAVAGVPIAWVADRKSRTRLIAIGIFFWSLMTALSGLGRTFWQVLLARIGVGVGEATLTPSANSLIADCFPRERVPLAISVFQAGASVGSGLAFVVGGLVLTLVQSSGPREFPLLGTLSAWQQVFLYCALPGLLLAPLILLLREPERRYLAMPRSSGTALRDIFAFYVRNRSTLLLHHFGFLCLALMGFGFVFWTVSFFVRVHGMEAGSAAQTFGWIYLCAGPLGAVWAPLLAARFRRSGENDANIKAAMIGGALAIPSIMVIQVMPSALWAFLLYAPAMFFVGSPFGLAYGSLPVIAPPQMRAVVVSVFMFTVNLGMLLGPPLAGLFNERIFPEADGVRYSLLTLTLIFGASGLTLLGLCRKHYARSLAAAEALELSAAVDTRA